jgi:4-amino-4-deoxy-L-arabinose transferase-like glycosyltransferase
MWAQRLDYGYYSKPPGIAFVIWAAQRVGEMLGIAGDGAGGGSGAALMPVIRMPAVVFGTISGLLSWGLARRMFRDDRVGLAVIVLSAAVPMFAVGSLLITIDSPMYLCWAGVVVCLWRVVEENSKLKTQNAKRLGVGWLYAAGVCGAVGMLFKPVLIALPLSVLVGMWWDVGMRRAFKTWHAVGALVVMALSQVPVVVWNANHGWVTFRHILTQGGMGKQASEAKDSILSRFGVFVGGQAGGMGGLIFFLLVLAVVVAFRELRRKDKSGAAGTVEATAISSFERTRWVFLLSFFLPLWGFYFVMNFWKGTEPNWPAASYFTGMILLAAVVVKRWHSPLPKVRRDSRRWTVATVIWGLFLTGAAMNLQRIYPWLGTKLKPLEGTAAYEKSWWNPRKWDPAAIKLRGMQARADAIQVIRQEMIAANGEEPLIIAGRYDAASSLNFYLPGHPFVYCIMSSVGGRQSQFDVWPGLGQRVTGPDGTERFAFSGKSAILVGLDMNNPDVRTLLEQAFTTIGPKEVIAVAYQGVTLKRLSVYRASGFRQPPERKGKVY